MTTVRKGLLAVYMLAVLNILALLGLTVVSAEDNSTYICSDVNGAQDCGYVLPEESEGTDLVVIGTRKVEKEIPGTNKTETGQTGVEAAAVTQPQIIQNIEIEPLVPVVQAPVAQSYIYPGAQGYSAKPMSVTYNGAGVYSATDTTTASYLSQLGYSPETLWSAGIKIVGYQGLVKKNCVAGSSLEISGMAVKPVAYTTCPSGEEVIPQSYKTTGKCTVHYDASKNYSGTSYGNSKAVLAHELSHCLHFIYGEYGQFDIDYKVLRGLENPGQTELREVMADDFMICRHGLDTSWGAYSYYNQYSVDYPSAGLCSDLNELFNRYFPV